MGISKILVIALVSLTSYALAIPLDDLLRQSREIAAQRRQYSTYTNNILHQNPNNPDQTAESSVKVSFNPNELNQQYNANYHQQQQLQQQQQNNPQSQLFNVGYSVSFTNGQQQIQAPPPSKYSRAGGTLDDGEIITGTRKRNEEVQLPFDMSPQDYVSAALIDSKKHKLSGIKPKPNKYQQINNFPNPKILLSQANLSPKTQKYYKVLEQVKTPTTNTQDLQKYSWRHLSPGVEIIKSTEVPVINSQNNKYAQKVQTPSSFDHARALGRSQDFDYSNAVDLQSQSDNQNLFYNKFNNVKSQVSQSLPASSAIVPQKQQQQNYVKVRLPMDTSLLRTQPVLTTNLHAELNDPAVIPIRIDTRLIHEAVMKEIAASNNYQQSSGEDLRGYHTINQEQVAPLRNPYVKDEQVTASRYPYKFYGNAQNLGRYAQQSQQVDDSQRQPRFTPEYNLQTDLRPPPVALLGENYQKGGILYKN